MQIGSHRKSFTVPSNTLIKVMFIKILLSKILLLKSHNWVPLLLGQGPIKTHTSVSVAKKTKENVWHTSVLFTGIVKLPNSAFHISKTTKLISTKFIYFLPYIYTTSHTKIEGNRFSTS